MGTQETEKPKFLLTVDYRGGVVNTPMAKWAPADVKAHMDYNGLAPELLDRCELAEQQAQPSLTSPRS